MKKIVYLKNYNFILLKRTGVYNQVFYYNRGTLEIEVNVSFYYFQDNKNNNLFPMLRVKTVIFRGCNTLIKGQN